MTGPPQLHWRTAASRPQNPDNQYDSARNVDWANQRLERGNTVEASRFCRRFNRRRVVSWMEPTLSNSTGSNCHRRPGSWQRAFTLIELTVVLLIMVLLASMAAPSYYNSIHYHQCSTSAQRVKVDLELARQQAIQTGTMTTVSFDVASDLYRMPPLSGLAAGVANSSQVDLSEDPYKCDLSSALFKSQPWITFDRFGLPHAGGAVHLTSGGYTFAVTVAGATGQVTVHQLIMPGPKALPESSGVKEGELP